MCSRCQRRNCSQTRRKNFLAREQSGRNKSTSKKSVTSLSRGVYVYLRPAEACHLSQAINNLRSLRPFKTRRPILGTRLQIAGRAVENQVPKRLREAIPIKNSRVEKLSESKRLQHPTSKPPRSLPLDAVPLAPDKTVCFAKVVGKLQSAEDGVDSDGHSHLLSWVDAKSQACERCTDGGRRSRC